MSTARLFIAVPIDSKPALREVLGKLAAMGSPVRAVDEKNLHLTLRFLGQCDLEFMPLIIEAMDQAVGDSGPFEMQLHGLGAFGGPDRPRVIWSGVGGGEPLVQIESHLGQALEEAGFAFEPEKRPYEPHVTLARLNLRRGPTSPALPKLLARHQSSGFGAYGVDGVSLVQSELKPAGPSYTVLATASLCMPGASGGAGCTQLGALADMKSQIRSGGTSRNDHARSEERT